MGDEERTATRVTAPTEKPAEKVGDLDMMKAAMLKLEEQLQGLTKAGLSRADFDAAFLKLTDEQAKLSSNFADALARMGVIETTVAAKAKERAAGGENVADWLLGFWA